MEKYLIYTHPAVAPIGIESNKVYSLKLLEKRFTLEEIKCFFTPDNFEWEKQSPKIKIEKE